MTTDLCHRLLDPGQSIKWNARRGLVVSLRPDGYLIAWDPYHDPLTLEDYPSRTSFHTFEEIARADASSVLQIELGDLKQKGAVIPAYDRSADEERRKIWRKAYVLAAETLISSGLLTNRRRDFQDKFNLVLEIGDQHFRRWQRERMGAQPGRGGALRLSGPDIAPPSSGAYLHRVFNTWLKEGEACLYDDYRRSGRHGSRLAADEEQFLNQLIHQLIDEERASISSVIKSVQAAFRTRNDQIVPGVSKAQPFRVPGKHAIRSTIERLAPLDHKIRSRGKEVAYRDMHGVGLGIETSRALERVEVDEHTLDLMVLLERTGVFELLPEELRGELRAKARAKRVVISMAIDVHTRCILAVKVGLTANTDMFLETLQMICSPKDSISDGIAQLDWPMYGKPEKIVVDRGPAYVADRSYDVLEALKIVNMGAAAKKPWLRPFIERMFETLHAGLIQRFPGRTFGNVVKKGENKAEERAALTVDELMDWLVRWIVDIYHTTPHKGLGGLTPYQAWMQAVQVVRPTAVPLSTMRRIFGLREQRKIDREGVTILDNVYASPELYEAFLQNAHRGCETRFLADDIGAIEVKLADGRWLTVPARDPELIGVSLEEFYAKRALIAAKYSAEHRSIHDRAVVELDARSFELKRGRGLAVQKLTPQKMQRLESQFQAFTDTHATREARGPATGIFADRVSSGEPRHGPPGSTSNAAAALAAAAEAPRGQSPSTANTAAPAAPQNLAPNSLNDLMD